MALSIKLSTFISGGYSGDTMRWKLKETGSGVYIDQHEETGPHGIVYNFSFNSNIRDIIYTIELYDVPPGGTIGTLIKSHEVSVTTSTIDFNSDIEIIVGGSGPYDPADGDTTAVIPIIDGKDYRVVQRAFGQLLRDRAPEVLDVAGGGFTLQNNQVFNQNDIFIVQIMPKYVVNPPGTVEGGSNYKDVVLITTDYTLLPEDLGKLFIVAGETFVTITFPAIASMIEKVPLFIESVDGVVLKAADGELITALSTTNQTFILGKSERGQLIVLGGNIYGFTDAEDAKKVGQIELSQSLSLNRLIADGSEHNLSDYPRLAKYLLTLPAGQVMANFATWNNSVLLNYVKLRDGTLLAKTVATKTVFSNKGFFAMYNDGGIDKFRVPDLRNRSFRALKNIGGVDTERVTNLPGGYQIDSFTEHYHEQDNSNSDGGFGKPATGGNAKEGPNLTTFATGGTETRPENIGLIATIII